MGKKPDLSDFDWGLVTAAGQSGLSISETADLLGFSPYNHCMGNGLQRIAQKLKTSNE